MTSMTKAIRQLIGNQESNDQGSLPRSAARVAGLVAPNPNIIADNQLAPKVASTTPPTSERRERVKPSQRSPWWPIALLIVVVAGGAIVAAANPALNAPGAEAAARSDGSEKLPEATPGSTLERTP